MKCNKNNQNKWKKIIRVLNYRSKLLRELGTENPQTDRKKILCYFYVFLFFKIKIINYSYVLISELYKTIKSG